MDKGQEFKQSKQKKNPLSSRYEYWRTRLWCQPLSTGLTPKGQLSISFWDQLIVLLPSSTMKLYDTALSVDSLWQPSSWLTVSMAFPPAPSVLPKPTWPARTAYHLPQWLLPPVHPGFPLGHGHLLVQLCHWQRTAARSSAGAVRKTKPHIREFNPFVQVKSDASIPRV